MAAASDIVASLAVKISGDVADFDRALSSSGAKARTFASDINNTLRKSFQEADREARRFNQGIGRLGDNLSSAGSGLFKGLTVPILGLGAASVKTFGDIDALKRGLTTVTGSAQKTEARFKTLTDVAKLPGLGLNEVVKADIRLRTIGFTALNSEKSIRAFGNAIASVGGGRVEFERAIYGLQQLANTKFPLGEDLNIIKDALPQVSTLLRQAFGTDRSDELAKLGITSKQVVDTIVTGLGRLPAATGGVKNEFENLSDTARQSFAGVGQAINSNLNVQGGIAALSSIITGLTDAFVSLSPGAQSVVLGLAGVAAATGPVLFGLGKIISAGPSVVAALRAIGLAGVSTGTALRNALAGGAVVALGALALSQYSSYIDSKKELDNKAINDGKAFVANYATLSKEQQKVEAQNITAQIAQIERRRNLAEQNRKTNQEIYDFEQRSPTPNGPLIGSAQRSITARTEEIKTYNFQIEVLKERWKAVAEFEKQATDEAKPLADAYAAAEKKVDRIAEILKDIARSLSAADESGKLFGASFDVVEQKIQVINRGIQSLLNEGLRASSREVQNLAGQLAALNNIKIQRLKVEFDDNPGLASDRISTRPQPDIINQQLNNQSVDNTSLQRTQEILTKVSQGFADAKLNAIAFGDASGLATAQQNILGSAMQDIIANKFPGYEAALASLSQKFQDNKSAVVAAQLKDAFTQAAGSVATGVGELVGGIAAGQEVSGKQIVGFLGGLAKQLGGALIAIGTPLLADPFTAPKGIKYLAMGSILTAAGAALSAGNVPGKRGVNGSGSGGGSSFSGVTGGFSAASSTPSSPSSSLQVSAINPQGSTRQNIDISGELILVDRGGVIYGTVKTQSQRERKTSG